MNIEVDAQGFYVFSHNNWSTKSKNLDILREAVGRAYLGSPNRAAALKFVDDYRSQKS